MTDADRDARVESLEVNVAQQAGRIRLLEKMLDTRSTPLWRRVVFRLDGWPSWTTVAAAPAWRPWRRRWKS